MLGGMVVPADQTVVYTPEQRAQMRAIKKVRRAATMAAISGWSTAVIGGLALPFGLVSWVSLVLGSALVALGVNELLARGQLLKLIAGATKRLALNQIVLGATIIVYAAFMVYTGLTGQSEMQKAVASEPALADMSADIIALEKILTTAIYGTLIIGTIVFQGMNAWYYASRRKWVNECLRLGVSPDPYAAITAQHSHNVAA